MPTTKTEVQTAWDQSQVDMKSLRAELRRRYEPASQDPELQTSLNKLQAVRETSYRGLANPWRTSRATSISSCAWITRVRTAALRVLMSASVEA